MSSLIPEWLRGRNVDIETALYENQKYKTHFSMFGPVGGGKTTIASGLVLTAATLSAQLGNFFCRIMAQSSHIISDANNLRVGRFPRKTNPYEPYPPEAGIMICERGHWREKKAQLGLCDVAGEIGDHMLINPKSALAARKQLADRTVIDYARDSQGAVLVLPAPKALMFRTTYTQHDPDEHVYNILSHYIEWKRRNHKEIKGIAVWLTQWDQIMKEAKDLEMDVYNPDQNGLDRFMVNGFPNVAMLLKPLFVAGKVKYFRSYFQTRKREDGETPETWEDDPTSEKIDIIDDSESYIRRKPRYSEQDYIDFIRWMGKFVD